MRMNKFLNTTKRTIYYFCFSLIILSCGEKQGKVSLPDELSKNEQVVSYFETLDEFINEYVNMIEELSEASKKNDGQQDIENAFGAFSSVLDSTMKMVPLTEKMEKLEKQGNIMKEKLTEQEILAFTKTYTKMLLRLQEASLKINY